MRDIRVMFGAYAARRATGRLGDEQLRLPAQGVTGLRRAARRGDIGAFRDADMSFHRHVCEAVADAAPIRLWRMIESSMWGLHVLGNPRHGGDWVAVAGCHAELLDALRGDVDRIAEPWGSRTPYGWGGRWPARVDTRPAPGVTEATAGCSGRRSGAPPETLRQMKGATPA